MSQKYIRVKGAKEHNLKNLSVDIPKEKLVVITGLSGSGKSTLAFNTIYEEGRRRYVESLSAYARQFLGGSEKPNVEAIEGLSPAISIDQKTTSHNPRSTVGTVTEIYDYLRLLYARTGTPYCINGHGEIYALSLQEIVDQISTKIADGTRLQILSPIVTAKKGTFQTLFARLLQEGFLRVKVDQTVYNLDADINLDKNQRHTVAIIIDRIVFHPDQETVSRLYDALEVATEHANGNVQIEQVDLKQTQLYSCNYACKVCHFALPDLEPRLFSFNSPIGACPDCKGLGVKLKAAPDLLIPDQSLSIRQGAIAYYKNLVDTDNLEWQRFTKLCAHYLVDLDLPFNQLKPNQVKVLLEGSDEPISYRLVSANHQIYQKHDYIEGVATLIERRFVETTSDAARTYYHKFMREYQCPTCHGMRLGPFALAVKIGSLNIAEFCELSITEALEFMLDLKLSPQKQQIAHLVLKEIVNRLEFLINVGLNYLSLSRSAQTLSGGEAQRIRLATQIGSQLSGVLYVLDEPSIGLHQRDNARLIATLKQMRDLGNTLLVVEHDEETMMAADWLIDIGPGAGEAGGKIVAEGAPEAIKNHPTSITGMYLSHRKQILVPKTRRSGNSKVLTVIDAYENNLKHIDVKFPLGKLICVTGISGSGKSTLVNEILYKSLHQHLSRVKTVLPGKHKSIKNLALVDKAILVSQEPIGRTPRSNPATYTGVFNLIRELFANTPEAKARGYAMGRFSFNVKGGRCDRCEGDGVIRIAMHFLPDVYIRCEVCKGKRYNQETLQVRYKGKNIYDILEMTVNEGLEFFDHHPKIKNQLQTLSDVGLGYIRLGQSATQLSGGEAQRIKLATYLQKRSTGKTIYILDEPTTGLHTDDIARLLVVLNRIVDNGDTVVVIEHNLDVIKVADYIIDLGPEGGKFGGEVVATGTPEQVAAEPNSFTGQYLKKLLNQNKNTTT